MQIHARVAVLFTALLFLGLGHLAYAGLTEGVAAYKAGRYSQALKELKPLAEHGNAKAEYYLGLMYAGGHGVTQDDKKAMEWMRKAAGKGLPEAKELLRSHAHESIVVDELTQLKAVTKILETVKDEKSANSAVGPLTLLIEKLKPIKTRIQTIFPFIAQDKDLLAKISSEWEAIVQTLNKERLRIKRQEALYKPLKKALGELELMFPEYPAPGRNFKLRTSFVLVDKRDPAFIVFTGIAKKTNARKLKGIRSKISNQQKVNMLTWKQFTASVDGYAQSVIVRNDHPNSRTIDGLICLVGKEPGVPWGLTWNGGIALTLNDYQYARRSYESYKTNPSTYRPIPNPTADPVNPDGFLPAFECLF